MNTQISLDQNRISEIGNIPGNIIDILKPNVLEKESVKRDKKLTIPDGYYSEEEMAGFLGKEVCTLRADHSARPYRVPPKTKIGGRIIYFKESFYKWLKEREDELRPRTKAEVLRQKIISDVCMKQVKEK